MAKAREEKIGVDARKKCGAILQSEQAQDARGARERFKTGALGETNETREARDAAGVRKQLAIDEIANGARAAWAFVVAGDLRAGEFDELAVFDAGRAGGFASATVEAAVDVRDERIAEREATLIDEGHLPNAAARGIGFVVPKAIRRAGIEAKSAMDAARVVGVIGLVAGSEAAERFSEFALSFFVSERRDGGHFFSVAPNH